MTNRVPIVLRPLRYDDIKGYMGKIETKEDWRLVYDMITEISEPAGTITRDEADRLLGMLEQKWAMFAPPKVAYGNSPQYPWPCTRLSPELMRRLHFISVKRKRPITVLIEEGIESYTERQKVLWEREVTESNHTNSLPKEEIYRRILMDMKGAMREYLEKDYEYADTLKHYAYGRYDSLEYEEKKLFDKRFSNIMILMRTPSQHWSRRVFELAKRELPPAIELKKPIVLGNDGTKNQRLFPLGRVVMTSGVAGEIERNPEFGVFVNNSLKRHSDGDWGILDPEDWELNEQALKKGERLLSVYEEKGLPKIYIITEWDRSVTTILFPEEY